MKICDWEYYFSKGQYKIIPNRIIDQPQYLCKYFSLKDYNIKALKENYSYFSHPLILNDPFDSCLQFISLDKFSQRMFIKLVNKNKEITYPKDKKSEEEIKHRIENMYKNDRDQLKKMALTFFWNIIFKDYGVFSLSSVDNDLLMWSYYTNHEGYLMKFKSKLFSNKEVIGPFPVNYADSYEIIYPRSIKIENEYLLYLTNIKSKRWKHEAEWRYIVNRKDMSIPDVQESFLDDNKRKVSYDPSCIDTIILGYKFFKGNVTDKYYSERKHLYLFQKKNNDTIQNINDKLKTDLLDYIIENKINVNQILTEDDNTFKLTSKFTSINCVNKGYEYIVETQE